MLVVVSVSVSLSIIVLLIKDFMLQGGEEETDHNFSSFNRRICAGCIRLCSDSILVQTEGSLQREGHNAYS